MTESEINLLDKMADAIIASSKRVDMLWRVVCVMCGFIVFTMCYLLYETNDFDKRLAAIEKFSGTVGKKIEAVERFATR
jgi:hypothetical protein